MRDDAPESNNEESAADLPSAETYRVGDRHPPLETRFKKGRSGNPRGRPLTNFR